MKYLIKECLRYYRADNKNYLLSKIQIEPGTQCFYLLNLSMLIPFFLAFKLLEFHILSSPAPSPNQFPSFCFLVETWFL